MSVINKLIRFQKFNLDEKRRHLRELEEDEAKIQDKIDRMDQEAKSEQTFSRGSVDFSPYYGAYAGRVKNSRDTLLKELDKMRQQVEEARETVVQSFQELKKYEITQGQQMQESYIEGERQSQRELDEIALDSYKRKLE